MVVNTNNTSHLLKVTPRLFPCTDIEIYITDSFRSTVDVVSPTYWEDNNLLNISFDYSFEDESNYQIKITDENSEVVFRGEILSTSQNTQDYSLTSNRYKW